MIDAIVFAVGEGGKDYLFPWTRRGLRIGVGRGPAWNENICILDPWARADESWRKFANMPQISFEMARGGVS